MSKKVVRIATNSEPTWDAPYEQSDVHSAFNWYNNNKTEKDAAKYLGIKDATLAKKFLTLAWATRMMSRGCVFNTPSMNTLKVMESAFKQTVKVDDVVASDQPTAEVISIQDRIEKKTDALIGEIEGALVDTYGIIGEAPEMNAYQWMLDNGVKPIHAAKIAEYFKSRLASLDKTYKDPELREYYQNFPKKRFFNLCKCYALIVEDAQKIANNGKVARKPRKKKPISFEKMVKGLKYLKKHDELKLQSADPIKIIGAQQVWVYNVKTRKLGVYNALDAAGLTVKGSTILNYSTDTSISKTLRKPEQVLKIVTDGGKIALRKVLDNVNSKPNELTGRINKDTIIVRIA